MKNSWIRSCVSSVVMALAALPLLAAQPELKWSVSEYATLSNGVLTVNVPPGAKSGLYGATAYIGLEPYEGRSLGATVTISGENIALPANSCHGLKFMLHFQSSVSGDDCWPDTTHRIGTFPPTKFEVGDTLSGGARSQWGTLHLGLQGTSGKVVFDMTSLQIVSGESFYPSVNHGYKVKYPDRVARSPQRRGVMLPARNCTEDDFKTLAEWGATLARYQMTDAPHVKEGETAAAYLPRYDAWLEARLAHLDREVLPWAVKYGLTIVIDLHMPPGILANGSSEFRMFREQVYLDAFVDVWKRIAARFKGRDGVYGYDLVNEPNQSKKAPWDYWTCQRLAAEAVRAIDPDTPIIIESNFMDSPRTFTYLSPLAMDNVIYEVHMYEPSDYTHQGVRGERDFTRLEYPKGAHNRDYLVKSLAAVRKFAEKHNARIYVGEFSAAGWAVGADQYLRDCIGIFKEYGWDWTYHAFREWPGWSVEHEPVKYGVSDDCFKPSADNPRKRALLNGLRGGEDHSSSVNPFIGCADNGHCYAAAAYPFGMVQAGPDTGYAWWDYCSGYRYSDERILGFSQTHLSGTGCGDLGDLLVMPFAGEVDPSRVDYSCAYRKETQIARPGYYGVSLDDHHVKVETTVARHSALYRFAFEPKGPPRMYFDLQHGMLNYNMPHLSERVLECEVKRISPRRFLGRMRTRVWVEREVDFAVEFDHDVTDVFVLPKRTAAEKAPRGVLSFNAAAGDVVMMKVALSTVSPEAAQANLDAEINGWDFEGARASAVKAWNEVLGRAELVGGTDAQREMWYTSLYHLFLQPSDIADVDGRYRGADDRIARSKTGSYYSTFSLWDTFRAAHPLYTILTPERVDDFVGSMAEHWKAAEFLPVWSLWGKDNQCMIGSHAVPVIADAYLKGFRGFDVELAWKAVEDSLRNRHATRRMEQWDILDRYGYYPYDLINGETVSRTLECAYDDACAARFAAALGRTEDAVFFERRSYNWTNVFDAAAGFMRGRDSKGNWRAPFDPRRVGVGAQNGRNDFTEGNSCQYTWHVMQHPDELVESMGGKDAFVSRLDGLFNGKSGLTGRALDVTGLIGQYAHGNEPSHHTAYFFRFAGRGDRTAEVVREVFDRFYFPKPDGLCGNDDCGQMSAWYLFSAMGFYPFNPCGGDYVIGAPQLPKVVLNLPEGKKFSIVAKNLSKESKYVKSVTLNGRPLGGFILRHADILRGGDLVFEMDARAVQQGF